MDAATLVGARSEEIESLEALGDAGRKEVRALEGRLRKSRRELEAGIRTREEEGWRPSGGARAPGAALIYS